MKSIEIFTIIVGMMMSVVGILICLTLCFPGYAMELGMTDGGLKSLLIIFVMWMFLFAVSMHVYAEETRRSRYDLADAEFRARLFKFKIEQSINEMKQRHHQN